MNPLPSYFVISVLTLILTIFSIKVNGASSSPPLPASLSSDSVDSLMVSSSSDIGMVSNNEISVQLEAVRINIHDMINLIGFPIYLDNLIETGAVIIDTEEELLKCLRNESIRTILMKHWRVICKQFELKKIGLIEACKSQEDIDLLVGLFHDYHLIQDVLPIIVKCIASSKALRSRFLEPMRYLFLNNPEIAFNNYSVVILNEFIDEDEGILSDFFKILSKLSWNKFQDKLNGINSEKMAQLHTITVKLTEEEDLKNAFLLERKIRFIHLMNRFKFPLRVVGESVEDFTLLEIENGFGIRGSEGLLMTCHVCKETIMTAVSSKRLNINTDTCTLWLSCSRSRNYEIYEYKHSCPNCNELLMIARDPFY